MAVEIAKIAKQFTVGQTVCHLGTGRLGTVVQERVQTERVIGHLGMTSHRLEVQLGSSPARTFHAHMFVSA